MFKGSITALITPMTADRAIDEAALQAFVDWQVGSGVDGLVPCGTTGESATLEAGEQERVIALCVEAAAGRVPVIAGAGANSTAVAIDHARRAEKAGADGLLVVSPYYNKPTQEGLYRHFAAVHDATDLPLVVYNIPGRAAVDIDIDTLVRLARLPNIVGIKDATGIIARISLQRAALGPGFLQFSGDDATALAVMAHGGHGCISVTANVAPALCASFQKACMAGDFAAALELQDRLMPLHRALFVESSPAPVKYAASRLGRAGDHLRLPLVPASQAARQAVDAAMAAAGLIGA